MFRKVKYSESKLLVELDASEPHEVFEPVVRKLGGVWNKTLNGWMFDAQVEPRVSEFIQSQNRTVAERQNKEYYTKFGEDPGTYNTPSSASSSSSVGGVNEAFDLIQELFDRVTDLERIVEEHGRKLRR
jgi:hypothetical protein